LDEVFAGIATAQANAEKNLQNAHALSKATSTVKMQKKQSSAI